MLAHALSLSALWLLWAILLRAAVVPVALTVIWLITNMDEDVEKGLRALSPGRWVVGQFETGASLEYLACA